MCVSAMMDAEIRKMEREYEAIFGWVEFEELFEYRLRNDIKILKQVELQIEHSSAPQAARIRPLIAAYRVKKVAELEQEIFRQKQRLGYAERVLKSKPTRKATEEQRIATNKIEAGLRRLADIKRTEPEASDSRLFPFYFAPIVVHDGKQKKIIAARYHCRIPDAPAGIDRRLPGLFNARRDSLESYWRNLFGRFHCIARITSFFENVSLHKYEHRELQAGEEDRNVVLHFNPLPTQAMHIACIYSRWQSPGQPELVSFAAVTDEPTPEVAVSGFDRTIIMLKSSNVDAWLAPQAQSLTDLYRLFDDRDRPYLEFSKAA